MQEFDGIGEDLFNKIRGRFPEVTIGDENGTVTNEPTMARFFDFDYNGLGKVSVAIEEDEGLTVIYAKDFMEDQDEQTKEAWYDFLKELRVFSKKRMLNYSVRDITKSNLTKRDYNFLAKTPEDEQMTESKLYGTSRISYQKVGEARIVIKHTEGINQESTTGRTQKIGKIYIESAGGERFRYPFKHLSGARAMARHVAEGGNTYDEFGKHIVGLSEEMAKLRKFKNYMGRSAVMAESLAGYVDVVKERIATVKKTIESLQKPAYYAETFAAFETPIMEDVPTDVQENWIDQLTIKQFNEELADVFPYIYKLVSEATKATELGPDDLDESGLMAYAGKKKHGAEYMKKAAQAGRDGASQEELGALKDKYSKAAKNKKTKEEIQLEQGFEEMMGQFSENEAEEVMDPEEQKTPLGEFILSYFDRENGQFPKGETAVLTMVEKDYGEQFIEPAKAFIEQITAKFDEWQMRTQPQQMEASGPCHHCSGSGHEMGNPGKACLDCGGTGKSAEKNEDAVDENFTQAAAAAARAHKTEFEYPKGSGKMHPVKMSKGTAHEINDDYDRIRELAGLR